MRVAQGNQQVDAREDRGCDLIGHNKRRDIHLESNSFSCQLAEELLAKENILCTLELLLPMALAAAIGRLAGDVVQATQHVQLRRTQVLFICTTRL